MLRLTLPSTDFWDPRKEEYVQIGGYEVDLEYSLFTIARWESKWKKPFITSLPKFTRKDEIEWYKAMCMTEGIPDEAWMVMTPKIRQDIYDYVTDPMSATTINHRGPKTPGGPKTIMTAELVYYYMVTLGVPFECEHWHFNRLMKLVDVCFVKNSPPKKMGKQEAAQMYRELNARNRAKYNSRGCGGR